MHRQSRSGPRCPHGRYKVARWEWYIALAMPISWFGFLMSHVHPALALVPIVPFLPDRHFHGPGDDHERHMPTLNEVRCSPPCAPLIYTR